jgi:subtilisin family serine protease
MHTPGTSHGGARRRARHLAAALALLLFALASARLWAEAARATPDCGTPAAEPFPTVSRAQLLERLGVTAWHRAGRRGQGVKVAVLDSGFRGYRAHLGGALPAHITVRSFRKDANLEAVDSQHGLLCAEVVHALAPDAELLLANWDPDRPERFLDAVRWAREQGARVISCSLIMPSWSDGEGAGPVHEGLARLLGGGSAPGDVLCFASAGNTAQRHWSGRFHDGGGGWHEWAPGHEDNGLKPWGSGAVSVELCWPGPGDFEPAVWDDTTGAEVGRSPARPGVARSSAVVHLVPQPGHAYRVRVRRVRGEGGPFHLVVLGGGLACATARGSIPFPADGPEVVAVGAVDADGRRAPYSSCGPNSRQPKPDLVAVVPFPSVCRARPFTGTSAAAPQAAAVAALVWSASPRWSAGQVRAALVKAARDLAAPGHDYETGYGLLALPPLD